MAEDINKVAIIGRLTRDAEQSYTQNGYALLKFDIAVNIPRKQGDQWQDEGHFFSMSLWGRQGEAIATYMSKGRQVGVEGKLKQDRWEAQDGSKRSKVTIEANNVQLLSTPQGRDGGWSPQPSNPSTAVGDSSPSQVPDPAANNPATSPQQVGQPAPQGPPPASFEDDIPF